MIAHQRAAKDAKIVHRDISAGNLLIYEYKISEGQVERRGLLNDWKLSKPFDIERRRQSERTVSK